MKYLFSLFIVVALSVFSAPNFSFAVVPVSEDTEQQAVNSYSELEKGLEEYCSDLVASGEVVDISISSIEASLTKPRADSDKAVSLEFSINSKTRFLFFDSVIIGDENEKSRLEEGLKLWILADRYVKSDDEQEWDEITDIIAGLNERGRFNEIVESLKVVNQSLMK